MAFESLTLEQKATNAETMAHIMVVQSLLLRVCADLQKRCMEHDQSKLADPEVSTFTEFTPKLAHAEYGSAEYKQFLKDMKPALDNHYANNSHHPEHYPNGINDMSLMDIVEMLVDWVASSRRTLNGNPYKSLSIQQERFGINPQLTAILGNTLRALGIVDPSQADNK